MIFFTATPCRTDGQSITESIKTHGFAYQLSEPDAIQSQIIRPIRFQEIKFKDEDIQYNPNYGPPVEDLCAKVVVAKVIECMQLKDKNCPLPDSAYHCAMLITANTDEAKDVFQVCQQKAPSGLEIACIHSRKEKQDLKAIMNKIERKEVRVFVIVKKLLEGFDYPPVSVVGIITRICSSLVFVQLIGQAHRVIPGESNVAADVITHECFEQRRLYDDFISGRLIPSAEELRTED